MAEKRDPVVPPIGSPLAPALTVASPMSSTELDDVDVPRSVSTAGLGPGATADTVDVTTAGSDNPDVIREQIERTREDMSQTINELQERLSPQHLAQQARDSVREATVGRVQQFVGTAGETATQVARRAQDAAGPVVEQVREQVREHPVPIALAGAGAGLVWWLMRRSSNRQEWSSNDMYEWDDDTTGTRDYASLDLRNADRRDASEWQSDGSWLSLFRDNPVPASIAAASIGYMLWSRRAAATSDDGLDMRSAYGTEPDDDFGPSTTERVTDAARDVTRQAREKASALGEQVSETVQSVRVRAGRVSRQTSTQFDRWMQDNPMAVGVAALAAGAVIGLSVPRTRAENQVMGASRDALVDRAADSAEQLKDQVRDKVQHVAAELTADTDSGTERTSATLVAGSPGSSGM